MLYYFLLLWYWPADRQAVAFISSKFKWHPGAASQQVLQAAQPASKTPTAPLEQLPSILWILPRATQRGSAHTWFRVSSAAALNSFPASSITPPGKLPVEFSGYPRRQLVSCWPDLAWHFSKLHHAGLLGLKLRPPRDGMLPNYSL